MREIVPVVLPLFSLNTSSRDTRNPDTSGSFRYVTPQWGRLGCNAMFDGSSRLGPVDDEREGIKQGCQQDGPKRDAEKILLGEKDVAEQQYQTKQEKKDGLEQEVAVCQSQVAVDSTEQDEAVAMTGVEADPGLPHRGLACDDRRDLLHARSEFQIAGQ